MPCTMVGHARHVDPRLQRRVLREVDRALADVHREVADALEVGDHLQRERDEAQVGGHRLALREDHEAQLVGLDLGAIDLLVGVDGSSAPASTSRSTRARTESAIISSTRPAISRRRSRSFLSSLSYSLIRMNFAHLSSPRSAGAQPNFPVM